MNPIYQEWYHEPFYALLRFLALLFWMAPVFCLEIQAPRYQPSRLERPAVWEEPESGRILIVLASKFEFARFTQDLAEVSGQETSTALKALAAVSRPDFVDIAVPTEAVAPAARQHAAFLVDMARAEGLDPLGENRAAVAIVERHV